MAIGCDCVHARAQRDIPAFVLEECAGYDLFRVSMCTGLINFDVSDGMHVGKEDLAEAFG